MQTTGYMVLNGKKILVLLRTKKNAHVLKVRKSGKDGQRLTDEEIFLNDSPEHASRLLSGQVVTL